jgi:glycosyltransferase involved in cell wall biosynthesis
LKPVLVSNRAGPFQEWAAGQGIEVHEIPLPRPNKANPWPFLRSLWRLRAIVKARGIQIIHCNEQDIYPIAQYLGRVCRLPIVVSVHFTMGRGYCRWAFEGKRRPTRIIFISRGSLEACRRAVEGIVPDEDWRILPNGLELEYFRPDPTRRLRFRDALGLPADAIVIGAACALRPRKQLEHLFEAVVRIDRPEVRVLLAGGPFAGDESYAEALVAGARERLGLRFVHLGRLDRQEGLRDFYNSLDLFVNTSKEEACSISVLESLACGCPVIGYPSKSVDEQVLPGGGEIVEQDRVDLLADALRRWISDPTGLTEFRTGARQRAEQAYDIRKLADRLWEDYREILAGWRTVRLASMAPSPGSLSGSL